jgi:hypothetical protein
VHAVPAHQRCELIPCHRLRPPALADADIAEHVLETGGRDDPEELQIAASAVLHAVPDPPAYEDHAARAQRDPPVLEHGRAAAGVHEDDFILMLVEVHGNRRPGAKTLPARGDERRSGAAAVDFDRDVPAAGRRPQPQRFPVARSQHQPCTFHDLRPNLSVRPI